MITSKDREIINFIGEIGFSTINQIAKVFYSHSNYDYDLARKKLKKISKESNYLKSIRNSETNQLIYIPYESKLKKISKHNILIVDYLTHIKELGVEIEYMEIEKDFDGVIPDLFLKFTFNGNRYCQLVEVELRHDFVDINRYKEKKDLILAETNGYYPDIVIIQNTRKDYEKDNETPMKVINIKTDLSDLPKVLL